MLQKPPNQFEGFKFKFLGGDVFGSFGEMLGEFAHAGPVGLLGAVADRPEIIGEGF
jgi:hypothetical protein